MDLNRVAVFARVVDESSFTGAARTLGLDKSSVSRQVALLEAELGIRLLQRTSRKLVLTDAGHIYYQRAREALAGLDDARETVASFGSEPSGVVRVTAPVDSSDELAKLMAGFMERYPRVRFEALLTARTVDLVQEGFDLAVRTGSLTSSSLLARKLGELVFGLFASTRYLDARGRPRRLADLARHDCILYRGVGGKETWTLARRGVEEKVEVRGRAQSEEHTFVRSMMLAGAGIAYVPISRDIPFAESGHVERVLPAYASSGTPLYVVWPTRRHEPAAVRMFRDTLIASLPASIVRLAGSSLAAPVPEELR